MPVAVNPQRRGEQARGQPEKKKNRGREADPDMQAVAEIVKFFTANLLLKDGHRQEDCASRCVDAFRTHIAAAWSRVRRGEPLNTQQWADWCTHFSAKWQGACKWLNPSRLGKCVAEVMGAQWTTPLESISGRGEGSGNQREPGHRERRSDRRNSSEQKAQPYICIECDVVCNSIAQFDTHCVGARHQSRVQMLRETQPGYVTPGPQPYFGPQRTKENQTNGKGRRSQDRAKNAAVWRSPDDPEYVMTDSTSPTLWGDSTGQSMQDTMHHPMYPEQSARVPHWNGWEPHHYGTDAFDGIRPCTVTDPSGSDNYPLSDSGSSSRDGTSWTPVDETGSHISVPRFPSPPVTLAVCVHEPETAPQQVDRRAVGEAMAAAAKGCASLISQIPHASPADISGALSAVDAVVACHHSARALCQAAAHSPSAADALCRAVLERAITGEDSVPTVKALVSALWNLVQEKHIAAAALRGAIGAAAAQTNPACGPRAFARLLDSAVDPDAAEMAGALLHRWSVRRRGLLRFLSLLAAEGDCEAAAARRSVSEAFHSSGLATEGSCVDHTEWAKDRRYLIESAELMRRR